MYQLSSILLSFGKWGILELLTSHSVFDGRGGMFGHAFPPRDGRIHLMMTKNLARKEVSGVNCKVCLSRRTRNRPRLRLTSFYWILLFMSEWARECSNNCFVKNLPFVWDWFWSWDDMSVHPASFKVNDDILPCCKIKQKIRKEEWKGWLHCIPPKISISF